MRKVIKITINPTQSVSHQQKKSFNSQMAINGTVMVGEEKILKSHTKKNEIQNETKLQMEMGGEGKKIEQRHQPFLKARGESDRSPLR